MNNRIRQINPENWPKGSFISMASISMSPEEIQKHCDLKFMDDVDDLDAYQFTLIVIDNKKYIAFQRYKGSATKDTDILIQSETVNSKAEVLNLLSLLNISESEISWIRND